MFNLNSLDGHYFYLVVNLSFFFGREAIYFVGLAAPPYRCLISQLISGIIPNILQFCLIYLSTLIDLQIMPIYLIIISFR